MIRIRRAAERATSEHPGIRSWHCFSAGAAYDPDNVSFGPVIGVDEHVLDPGRGFAEHPHRGVQILTCVLAGALRHRDEQGEAVVGPGEVLVQVTGSGIRHVEENASDRVPVRFVQTILLGNGVPRWWTAPAPVRETVAEFSVVTSLAWLSGTLVHAFVADGSFHVNGEDLAPGDSVRALDEQLVVEGTGQLLVVRTDAEPAAGSTVSAVRT